MRFLKFISNYIDYQSEKDQRSFNTYVQIIFTLTIRIVSLVVNFALVPVSLSYVGVESFGLWLVMFSVISWFSLFDIGLGHGLRNKLTEALAVKDFELAKIYVSTAYVLLGAVSLFLFVVMFAISPFIDWLTLFNTKIISEDQMLVLVLLLIAFVCPQFVLKLVSTVLTANQRPSVPVLINTIANCIVLSLLIFFQDKGEGTLIELCLIYMSPILALLLLTTIILFSTKYKAYRPSLNFFNLSHTKDILGLGFQFFILQMELLVLYQLGNIIIINFFGAEEVVQYNLAHKYFVVPQLIFAVIMNTYWSAFTDAMSLNDMLWIKKSVKKLMSFWMLLIPLTLFMLWISNDFYIFWIGDQILIPFSLSIAMCVYVLFEAWNSIFEYCLQGLSRINVMLITACTSVVLYLPLVFLIIKKLQFGVEGIIIAFILCRIINSIILPIQCKYILNNRTHFLFNKNL